MPERGELHDLVQAVALCEMLRDRLERLDDVVSDEKIVEVRDLCEQLADELKRIAPSRTQSS